MKTATNRRLLSLFSGCGGMDLSFKNAGFTTVWANDFNQDAVKTFKQNISDTIALGSIEDFKPENTPEADIIIGGFPCQDFSVIWKQPGLNGTRGGLYRHFLEFVRHHKPKIFIAENVRGILSANNGKAIEQIITDFQEIEPAYILYPKLYNFAGFGVPQFRERVIIVGVRIDTDFNFKHPKETHGDGAGMIPYLTAGEALLGVQSVAANSEHQKMQQRTIERLKLIPAGGNYTAIPADNPLHVKGMISHVYRRIDPDRPSTTIIAAGGGGTWGYHYPEPRSLTNRERARLQSFPDDFVFDGSFSEVRKQIGNSVPPQGLKSLISAIEPLFDGNYNRIDLRAVNATFQGMTIKERLAVSKI